MISYQQPIVVRLWATPVEVSGINQQVWSFRLHRQRKCKVKHLFLIKTLTQMHCTRPIQYSQKIRPNKMYVLLIQIQKSTIFFCLLFMWKYSSAKAYSIIIVFWFYFVFSIYKDDEFADGIPRSMSANDTENKMLPTVFRWEGGGKQVFISGTFSEWKPIPMVQRYFHVIKYFSVLF